MPEYRILLADDHRIVRQGLRAILEEDSSMEVVGEASNGREAVELTEKLRPHVAVIDVGMPQLNGLEAAAHIHKAEPSVKLIILSMYRDETYILRALTAGAKAYLLKDAAEDEILPAIRAVLRGSTYFSPAIAQTLLDDHVRYLRKRGLQDSYDLLTEREREVLQLLAEGRSNKDVAAVLNLSLSTVETHRTNMMQKLNLHSSAEIVLYAVRKKLIRQ
jgi:two-component system, NarL family, response regulator NreC